jgi:hypothetical protein
MTVNSEDDSSVMMASPEDNCYGNGISYMTIMIRFVFVLMFGLHDRSCCHSLTLDTFTCQGCQLYLSDWALWLCTSHVYEECRRADLPTTLTTRTQPQTNKEK